jgi:hypothetical protein
MDVKRIEFRLVARALARTWARTLAVRRAGRGSALPGSRGSVMGNAVLNHREDP